MQETKVPGESHAANNSSKIDLSQAQKHISRYRSLKQKKNLLEGKNMKKILGVPLVMVVIGLVVIGGAMAALVNYLSNQVEATVGVDSPLTLQISSDGSAWGNTLQLGSQSGGNEITTYTRLENHANTALQGHLSMFFREANNASLDWDCDMLTLTPYIWDGTDYIPYPLHPNVSLSCQEETINGTTGLAYWFPGGTLGQYPGNWSANSVEYYKIEGKLHSQAKPGSYVFEAQVYGVGELPFDSQD